MGNRRILSLVALVIAIGAAWFAVARATSPQIAGTRLAESLLSTGPLHDEHRDITCVGCHQPFRGVQSVRCVTGDCHPQTKLDQAKPAVVAMHEKNADLSCLACHTDHRGRTASLTEFKFHQKASRDSEKDCAACHGAEGEKAHPQIKVQDCAKCHDTAAWSPARFDHGDLAVADRQRCADCHLHAGRRAHAGIRSTDCAACHTSTARWSEVSFSHSQVTGEPCASCHRAPGGWLHASAGGVSCGACHSTRAWEPSTFRHPRIPEYREHMEEVGCRGCHPTSLTRARPCEDCHRGGRFED